MELAVAEHALAACLAVLERVRLATRLGSRCGAGGRLVGHQAEAGFVAADGHSGQDVEDFLRHGLGEFHGAELVEQLDAPDVGTADVAFAGDGAYDVLGCHVVAAAHAQVVAQVAFLDAVVAFLAFLAESALFFAVEAEVVAFVAATAFARGIERFEFRE